VETTRQFCTFYVADQYFGVEVLRVQEVIRYQPVTPVPLASEVVEGLINLRGQIVVALDMRRRLMVPEREDDRQPMNIIIRCDQDNAIVSLLVDEIGDVIEVEEDAFEAPPDTLRGPARKLIRGAYKLPDRLMLVLDTDGAVSLTAN
jgi:purine-binding chemotaxis protein CheW